METPFHGDTLYDLVTAQIEHERDAAESDQTRDAVGRIEAAVVAWRSLPREPDPWPVIEWLSENYPSALKLCPFKVRRV